jgi:hypothetical protein
MTDDLQFPISNAEALKCKISSVNRKSLIFYLICII